MDKIKLINPVEGENTHIESHKEINNAISLFQNQLNNIEKAIKELTEKYKDVENRLTTSFSHIAELHKDDEKIIQTVGSTYSKIKDIEEKLNEGGKYLTRKYEGIVDTDTQVVLDLDPISEEDMGGKNYLVNIVVNEALPNQGTMAYSFPNTSLAFGEYTPHIYLMAKEGEHAVLEYDFTVILTEI